VLKEQAMKARAENAVDACQSLVDLEAVRAHAARRRKP
jgi:hypothetical protein